mgnify:CR=1 FL=1
MNGEAPGLCGPRACGKIEETDSHDLAAKPGPSQPLALRVVSPAPGPDQGQEVKPEYCDGRPLSRLEFLAAMVKLGVRGAELAVAAVLARRFNDKKGVAWPSINRLAAETGYKTNSVCRALAGLQARGLVTITKHGGPHLGNGSNRYSLALAAAWSAAWGTSAPGSTSTNESTPPTYFHQGKEGTSILGGTVLPPVEVEPCINPGNNPEFMQDGSRPGNGPTAVPGRSEEEEGPDVEAALRRMLTRHVEALPHKATIPGPGVFGPISDAIASGTSMEFIEEVHAAWCLSYKPKSNPAWDPALETWIGKRTWEKAAAPAKAADPKAATMAENRDRPALSVLVGEDWDPDTCAECAGLADEARGDSCPVATCPAAALALVDGKPRVDSARCSLCGECWSGCPSQGFSLVARPEALPEAKDGEEYGRQVRSLREALRMGVPTFAEFCGLGGEKEVAILLALEGGAGWAPRAIFDALEEAAGIPLPKTELERRERATR